MTKQAIHFFLQIFTPGFLWSIGSTCVDPSQIRAWCRAFPSENARKAANPESGFIPASCQEGSGGGCFLQSTGLPQEQDIPWCVFLRRPAKWWLPLPLVLLENHQKGVPPKTKAPHGALRAAAWIWTHKDLHLARCFRWFRKRKEGARYVTTRPEVLGWATQQLLGA